MLETSVSKDAEKDEEPLLELSKVDLIVWGNLMPMEKVINTIP